MIFLLAPLPVILQIASVLFGQNMQQKLMLSKSTECLAILLRFQPSANVDQSSDFSDTLLLAFFLPTFQIPYPSFLLPHWLRLLILNCWCHLFSLAQGSGLRLLVVPTSSVRIPRVRWTTTKVYSVLTSCEIHDSLCN